MFCYVYKVIASFCLLLSNNSQSVCEKLLTENTVENVDYFIITLVFNDSMSKYLFAETSFTICATFLNIFIGLDPCYWPAGRSSALVPVLVSTHFWAKICISAGY